MRITGINLAHTIWLSLYKVSVVSLCCTGTVAALLGMVKSILDRVCQEPITRSLQVPHIPVTAFSQTDLSLVWIYLEFRPTGTSAGDQLQSQAQTNVDMWTWCRHVHVGPRVRTHLKNPWNSLNFRNPIPRPWKYLKLKVRDLFIEQDWKVLMLISFKVNEGD